MHEIASQEKEIYPKKVDTVKVEKSYFRKKD